MPCEREPMKDAAACDKPREGGEQPVIRGFPNGETYYRKTIVRSDENRNEGTSGSETSQYREEKNTLSSSEEYYYISVVEPISKIFFVTKFFNFARDEKRRRNCINEINTVRRSDDVVAEIENCSRKKFLRWVLESIVGIMVCDSQSSGERNGNSLNAFYSYLSKVIGKSNLFGN